MYVCLSLAGSVNCYVQTPPRTADGYLLKDGKVSKILCANETGGQQQDGCSEHDPTLECAIDNGTGTKYQRCRERQNQAGYSIKAGIVTRCAAGKRMAAGSDDANACTLNCTIDPNCEESNTSALCIGSGLDRFPCNIPSKGYELVCEVPHQQGLPPPPPPPPPESGPHSPNGNLPNCSVSTERAQCCYTVNNTILHTFVRMENRSCITPYYKASASFTLQQCQDECRQANCTYFSRPGTASETSKSNCWVSRNDISSGTCEEAVYQKVVVPQDCGGGEIGECIHRNGDMRLTCVAPVTMSRLANACPAEYWLGPLALLTR